MAARLAPHPEEHTGKASVFDDIVAALVAALGQKWQRRVSRRRPSSQGGAKCITAVSVFLLRDVNAAVKE